MIGDKVIQVRVTKNWGKRVEYPICRTGHIFRKISKAEATITPETRQLAEELGYKFEEQYAI